MVPEMGPFFVSWNPAAKNRSDMIKQ
jgi:hypothetical protein